MNTNRFQGLLSRTDELAALVADLHDKLVDRLHRGDEKPAVVFAGCHACAAAKAALDALRITLFAQTTCRTLDESGKMDNPKTVSAWELRVRANAGMFGLEDDAVQNGLLETAELQYSQAWHHYEEAKACS